jgi:hypothetical protein
MNSRIACVVAMVAVVGVGVGVVAGGQARPARAESSEDGWEYLVVAGGTTNLMPSGSSSMRKEPSVGFERESFALERNLDKLGAKGWELVAVLGSPADPTYYLKRRKS